MIAVVFALLVLAPPLGLAQFPPPPDDPPPLPPQLAPSVQGYGDIDKTCFEWSDGCRACRRAADDTVTCPNIGIACLPQAITCSSRSPMALPLPPVREPPKPDGVPLELPKSDTPPAEQPKTEPAK